MNAHRMEYYGPWLAAVAVGLSFLLLASAGVYTFRQQNHVNSRLCEITVQNRESTRTSWQAVRSVLLRSIEENATTSEGAKAEARLRTNSFVDAVLLPIPALECIDNQPVPREG